MNTLLTTAAPGGRSAAPRASDTGRSHSAAPFASALDGALSENRASDRGVERRGLRDDRATEHGAAKEQRVEDRSRAAAERAADRTAPDAAPDDSNPTLQPTADAEEAVPDAPVPERRDTDEAGQSAEPPRGGLPALWALMMGASLGGARPEDAPATDPQAAVPAVPPVDAAADALPMIATRGSVSTDPAVDGAATAAAGPIGGALTEAALPTVVASAPGKPATAATAGTGSGPLATMSAAIAAAGAVVTDRIAPAAPPAPVQASAPAPTAPAAPAVPPGAPPPDAPGSPDRAAIPTATATPGGPLAVPVPQPTGADVAPADLGGSPELAVASLGTTGEAVPTDTDGTGQNPPGSAPATTGPTSVGTAGPAPGTTAVPDVDGARGADPAPPVGIQVARQVAVLRGGPDGAHSMTLVLTPETLGPVEVQVIVTKGSVELALRGASEQGRAALLDGLPDLRRDLEAAGLSCTRVEVDRETGGSWLDRQPAQQQTSGERSGHHDRGDDRSRPGGRTADSGGSGTSAPQNRFTSSSLDVLA